MNKSDSKNMTAKQFAEKMQINYRTALRWLEDGLVNGAVRKDSPVGAYWDIPAAALEMERPKPGPKPKKSKNIAE
jgi:hypothetical protein